MHILIYFDFPFQVINNRKYPFAFNLFTPWAFTRVLRVLKSFLHDRLLLYQHRIILAYSPNMFNRVLLGREFIIKRKKSTLYSSQVTEHPLVVCSGLPSTR